MNGLALRDGRPATVTAVSRADVADGWRDARRGGGRTAPVAAQLGDRAGARWLLAGLLASQRPFRMGAAVQRLQGVLVLGG